MLNPLVNIGTINPQLNTFYARNIINDQNIVLKILKMIVLKYVWDHRVSQVLKVLGKWALTRTMMMQ